MTRRSKPSSCQPGPRAARRLRPSARSTCRPRRRLDRHLHPDLHGRSSEVTDRVILDVLPDGVQYVAGTASSDGQFTFKDFGTNAGAALTWTAGRLKQGRHGDLQGQVHTGACETRQPLENTATIDSAETGPDDATSPTCSSRSSRSGRPRRRRTAYLASRTERSRLEHVARPRGPGGLVLGIGFITPVPSRAPPEPSLDAPTGRTARSRAGLRPVGRTPASPTTRAATPSGVRPGRSTDGGVPRSSLCGKRQSMSRLEPGIDELDRPVVVSSPGRFDRRLAVVAHLRDGSGAPGRPRSVRPALRRPGPSRCSGPLDDRPRPERHLAQQRIARSRPADRGPRPSAIARIDEPVPVPPVTRNP